MLARAGAHGRPQGKCSCPLYQFTMPALWLLCIRPDTQACPPETKPASLSQPASLVWLAHYFIHNQEIVMSFPITRVCALLCAVMVSTGLAAMPALAAPGAPPPPATAAEVLSLSPAQTRLWQAASAASRESHAHALELHARFIRDAGEPSPDAPLRPRLQALDRLHGALEQDRRTVREQWLALDDSLDAGQRRRLRAMPEVARWLELPPGGMSPGGTPPGRGGDHGPGMPAGLQR